MRQGFIAALLLTGLMAAASARADDMKGMDMSSMSKDADAKAVSPTTVVLVGEVLDMDCYMNEGAHGKDHQSCAVMCLNNGAPVGLLTADGKAYFLTANEDKGKMKFYDSVRGWGGEKAKITGVVQKRAGALCVRIDGAEKL
jgi:hypothetical protein